MLGVLAGGWAGVLAAFAGLIPAVLWQIAIDRRRRDNDQAELLEDAARRLVPPGMTGGVARYLRPENAVVGFWPRRGLRALREWAFSTLGADIGLVTGEGGAGKTRLALQLGQELKAEFGWRSYWVPSGEEASAADAWLPPARLMHPFPAERFHAKTQGRSPVR